ncbi:putative oligopeptide transporter 4-like [Iris pallida]|uniref:Oligopeptide transporter 4-like n=1 Tax=Iris pallida TaxID=29817 RepID=A0AAX6GZE4_IRIPA|nr:putative oligopeptide transporter 4-like [Iris pallida]
MCHCRGNGGEAEAVGDREEGAEIDPPSLLILLHVDLEMLVHDRGDVVRSSVGHEQVRGKYGEVLGVVEVQAPVGHRGGNVDHEDVPGKDVGYGEEGADEGAEEEGGDGRPVESERAEAQAFHAGPELLGRDGPGEGPADPRDAREGREEVAGDDVPREAADQGDDEELGARHSASLVLLVQCPVNLEEDFWSVSK